MYDRLLNKEIKPTLNDMYNLIGSNGTKLLEELNNFMQSSYEIVSEIKFPFGNNYGWGIKYSHKSKHLCYIFPEENAFTVTIQIGKAELPKLHKKLETFLIRTQELWEQRYPCGNGGWIHYRVFNAEEIEDIKELIRIKKKPVK